jgi:hypothetical protein
MTRATFWIAVAFLCSTAAAAPLVTFESPCECLDNHGQHRRAVKNDPSTPPADASAIQAVTPSDVFSWPGPAEHLTQTSERTGIENNWFALTGRVVAVKVEMDGDLHVALQDATGDKAGIVVCEIPAKQQWCSIRETVSSWTTTRFPFHTSSDRKLKLIGAPIITVTGKAYWDVGHARRHRRHPALGATVANCWLTLGVPAEISPATSRLSIPSFCRRSARCRPPPRRGYGGRRRPDDSAAHRAYRASVEHCRY